MPKFRLPGVIWVVIIAAAIVAVETFVPAAYQLYGEVAVVAIMAIAKSMNIGGDEIDAMVKKIHEQQNQGAIPRGVIVPTPRKRGKVERWLVG